MQEKMNMADKRDSESSEEEDNRLPDIKPKAKGPLMKIHEVAVDSHRSKVSSGDSTGKDSSNKEDTGSTGSKPSKEALPEDKEIHSDNE